MGIRGAHLMRPSFGDDNWRRIVRFCASLSPERFNPEPTRRAFKQAYERKRKRRRDNARNRYN